MSIASNRYFLNGVDLFDIYGYAVASGSDDFLRPPNIDEPFSHKFGDQNGKQWDLSSPTFTPGEATLKGTLIADSASDFWTKYDALFGPAGALRTPGTKTLTIVEFDRVFEVFYREVTNIKRHTRLKFNPQNKIFLNLDIRFEVLNSYPIAGQNYFYAGPVASWPTTWNEVSVLSTAQPEYLGQIIEMNTGTTRKAFVISVPQGKAIKRVLDLSASNVNLTGLFSLQAAITNPQGVTYFNYGFEQGMPYSTNHVYRIELM